MKVIRCAGACGHRIGVAGQHDSGFLSAAFAALDVAFLTGQGWSFHGRAWWCRYCTRRRNLLHAVPASNVTKASPPTGEKM